MSERVQRNLRHVWFQITFFSIPILGSGAYTPGVLSVRRTPSHTDRDVTFSGSCDQGKITNKA